MMTNSLQSRLKRWKTSHLIGWVRKHKYLPWWRFMQGRLRSSIFLTGCFCSSRLVFPVSIPPDRKREGIKERKEGQRKRERQKYREREDTLGQTDHQWPSFPQLCQWVNWSLLPGWLCVWMRCVLSYNTHQCSYFSKWMSYNHINTQDGCGIFLYLVCDYFGFAPVFFLPTVLKQSTEWPSKWLKYSGSPFYE